MSDTFAYCCASLCSIFAEATCFAWFTTSTFGNQCCGCLNNCCRCNCCWEQGQLPEEDYPQAEASNRDPGGPGALQGGNTITKSGADGEGGGGGEGDALPAYRATEQMKVPNGETS
ncbi:hypothetical protein IE53DRAFT_386311 [Violaceomyces palustris]|uniref:Uncharacterized protein n=1 Tax=Violaceomyces palustris TaxID=1673888 RepID=A0ACD0P022_9BASI|nr:hypothetical protein IE53DRAFT_386311 [Violaceomyces palustris]